MSKKTRLTPTATEQTLLEEVRVVLIPQSKDRQRFQRLLKERHYLGSLKPVGEQLYYVAADSQGNWLALLLFSAASKHLKHRERWIGWTPAQCDRRLGLVVNNSRFLILPDRSVPNLGSRVLRLALDRLGADWQAQYRGRVESYPAWSLLTLILLSMLCEAPRGQKDLAKFARRLTQAQRRVLGFRRNPQGRYPAPCQSTFSRLLQKVQGRKINEVLLAIQKKARGRPPMEDLIVVDGKEPKHGTGDAVLSAVTVPSQFYLGSALVDTKTNEIPVARELFTELELAGRRVALDALHTQDQTARDLALEHGADYLLTVKNNQPSLRQNIEKFVPVPQTGFSPFGTDTHTGANGGKEQGSPRKSHD